LAQVAPHKSSELWFKGEKQVTYQTFAPWPALQRQILERFAAAALIILLLSQTLLEIFPATMFNAATPAASPMAVDTVTSPLGLKPAAPPIPPLWLPQDLVGRAEVVSMRTANSATYYAGNNTFATVQELTPIHYQDQNAQWQRIDPAFVETPLGWLNGTNSVRTLVEKRHSKATIAAHDLSVRWQPAGLVTVDDSANGSSDRATIAEPLPVALAAPVKVDATATVARYTKSWSLEGLQDQWQTSAGRSEYTMRLAKLPATEWWRGAPDALDLRVRLQLDEGTTLHVEGKPVALPFATQRAISFVGANGEAMLLLPPRTYEQQNPDASVAAEYLLSATEEADVVELRVRTPWAWLAAPERAFPVIIDPVFQLENGTFGAFASYYAESNAYNNLFDFSNLGVGRVTQLLYERTVLRFELPIMPFGTTIAKAYLHAVPQDTNPGTKDPAVSFHREHLKMRVSAHVLDADWEMNQNGPTFDANPLPPGLQSMEFSRGADIQKGVTWDVTVPAQGWLRYPGVPSSNPGLLLRAENEQCELYKTVAGQIKVPNEECGAFFFKDVTGNWSDDDLLLTNALTRADALYTNQNSESGGIRLVVYFNGPTLNHNSRSPADVNAATLPIPIGKEPYFRADHVYTVPAMPDDKWHAFVARGRGASIGINPPPEHGNIFRIPVDGAAPLSLRRSAPGQAPLLEKQLRSVKSPNDEVNYILFNGRGTPSEDFDSNNLLYVESASTVSDTVGYDVRSIQEIGAIDSPVGTQTVTTYEFDSADPMAIWNMALPTPAQVPGATTQVLVEIFTDQTESHTALNVYGREFDAALIHSTKQSDLPTSPQVNAFEKSNYTIADFSKYQDTSAGPVNLPIGPVLLASRIFSPGSGQHALALTYGGPEIVANDTCDPNLCGPELAAATADNANTNSPDATAEIIHVSFLVRIKTLTCPAGSFPLQSGVCQQVKCPTDAQVPQGSPLYREAGNLGLWSIDGWAADGATQITPAVTAPPPIAPVIGATGRGLPTVAVLDGRVRYNTTPNPDSVLIEGDASTTILLIECQPNKELYTKFFQVYTGPLVLHQLLVGLATVPSFEPAPDSDGAVFFNAWQAIDLLSGDVQNEAISIRPSVEKGLAIGSADLRRRTGAEGEPVRSLRFDVAWSIKVDGYPTLTSSVEIDQASEETNPIATLGFDPGVDFEMDIPSAQPGDLPTTPRLFEAVRALLATVTQDARLGGASKNVRALILPPLFPMTGVQTTYCPASCIDLRAPDDTRLSPKRKWAMPDIHTNNNVGTLAMSTPGSMTVFSTDAPNANPDAAHFSQEFSFDAFSATVSIEKDYCLNAPNGTPMGEIVLVIKGETRIAMPNIGSTNDPAAGISASFKLCDLPPDGLGLRSVHLSFDSPVGIPIGTSGLFLTGLEGGVSIYPEYTEIEFGLDFQTEPTGPGGVLKGGGKVLISTLGLFDYQGHAKLLGVVNAEGHLWVAWNPIDIGFEVSVTIGDWLEGNAHAHMWKGRGFYNYTWLPDNDDMHFTAGVSAYITIEEGAVIDTEILTLPWEDIVFGIELEFGEFCTNNNCTTYEWGVKGAFVIGDYHVGLYYGFDEGLDLILGNDDHILIDQYGSASAMVGAASTSHVAFAAAPAQNGDTTLIPFNVSSQSEEILVGLSWQAGAPALSLIKPDGVEINAGNAAAHQAQVLNGPNAIYITVKMPAAGAWQAKVSSLSEAGVEHYKFIYLSNKGAPGGPGNQGAFTAPGNGSTQPVDGFSEIQWSVPGDTPPTAKVSLYYQRTEVITGNLLINVPIVKNLPFSEGHYSWDTRKLLNGNYKVHAVVDDGVNDLPEGQISLPDDVCTPASSGLPPARAFDPNRFPGTVEFTSAGTIQIADSTAPDAPTNLAGSASDSALMITWNAPAAVDVAGYLVRWGPRRQDNPQAFIAENQSLLLAGGELKYRTGAVTNDIVYGVDIAALDVNGNSSAPTAPLFLTPSTGSNPLPGVPTNFALSNRTSNSAGFQWQAGDGPAAANYELEYVRAGDISEIASLVVNTTNGTISDLPTGASYDVRVRALNSAGWTSAYISETVRILITNGVDGNGDGMADDWAAAFGVPNAGGDLDGDGISNAAEYNNGTDPTKQDSDGDGFSDKEEADSGTDPMNGLLFGATISQPRLALEKTRLRFYGKDQEGGLPAVQNVAWANVGGGSLVLQATTEESWIQASIDGDQVQVGVKSDTLEPGFYSGIVRLLPGQGSDPIIGDPACIRVNTWVAYGDNDIPSEKQSQTINFPPLADRRINTPAFAVSASASSGLPVTIISSTPSVCVLVEGMVTLLAEGVCTLVASQPGDETHSAAPDVLRSFTILPEDFVYTTYLTQIMNAQTTK
jgi:hypothetical protein